MKLVDSIPSHCCWVVYQLLHFSISKCVWLLPRQLLPLLLGIYIDVATMNVFRAYLGMFRFKRIAINYLMPKLKIISTKFNGSPLN